jgi:hypothetical protein
MMADSWIVSLSKIVKQKTIDVLVQYHMEELLKDAVKLISMILDA